MSKRSALRAMVFVIGGLETLALVALLVMLDPLGSSDPLGRAIGQGVALLASAPYVLFVLPALIMAASNRFLRPALALTLLAPIVEVFLWRGA